MKPKLASDPCMEVVLNEVLEKKRVARQVVQISYTASRTLLPSSAPQRAHSETIPDGLV